MGDSRENLGITFHPASSHRLSLWASGFPSAGVSVPGVRGPLPFSPQFGAASASLARPHPRGAQTPPSRGGCGHQGRLGRPLPRSLRSSRVARKARKPFHEHGAEPRFCVEEGAGNGRSGLGLPGSSLDSRPQNRRRLHPLLLAFRGLVVSVREVPDPIHLFASTPRASPTRRRATRDCGGPGGGREAAWKRRRRPGGGVGCYLWLSSCMSGVESS